MSVDSTMLYNTQMPQFPDFDDSQWSNGSTSLASKRHWAEETRRSPADMSAGFQQAYLSNVRTAIDTSPVDSPASYASSLMLPADTSILPSIANNSHVPRGLGFIMDSASSTDSDDGSETTASSQWHNNYHNPYAGRASPHARFQSDMSSRSSTNSPNWSSGLSLQIPTFDTHTWGSMLGSAPDSSVTPYTPQQTLPLNSFGLYSISPVPSTPPPPMYHDTLTAMPSSVKPNPSFTSQRGGRGEAAQGQKKCSHCQATTTPLWRRDPNTFKPLCNACGLYLQQRRCLRPQELIDADTDDGNTTDESDANYVGPECSHCRTHHTSVWRRSKTGAQLCNACGVYQRLRGKPRPLSLKRNKIKPRSKHPKPLPQ